jgi:disulfide bond formation protein DsbB
MKLREWGLTLAWLVALGGMLMSLFYSSILFKEPCNLCWFQRIALFPLAVQLGISAYRSDKGFAVYAYPLCFFGLAIALLQSILPLLPAGAKSCGVNGDCTADLPVLFGIQFPWISAVGFILIAWFVWVHRKEASPPPRHSSE